MAEDVVDDYRSDGRRAQGSTGGRGRETIGAAGEDHPPAADHVQVRDRHVRIPVEGARLSQTDVNPSGRSIVVPAALEPRRKPSSSPPRSTSPSHHNSHVPRSTSQ